MLDKSAFVGKRILTLKIHVYTILCHSCLRIDNGNNGNNVWKMHKSQVQPLRTCDTQNPLIFYGQQSDQDSLKYLKIKYHVLSLYIRLYQLIESTISESPLLLISEVMPQSLVSRCLFNLPQIYADISGSNICLIWRNVTTKPSVM